MPDHAKAFFVSTPIYYVTAAPSIGSAYTTVAADMIARWHRQRGEETFFLTGTDEHGQKVLEAATAAGQSPQEFTDRLVAEEWLPVLDVIDASNDDFIRTTDARTPSGCVTSGRRSTTTATSTRARTRAPTAWPARSSSSRVS
jgi:methionyl-tRNA synthetase